MIRVFNLHEFEKDWPGKRVYVGPDSALENAFGIVSGNTRAEGIELFRHWLWRVMQTAIKGGALAYPEEQAWLELRRVLRSAREGDVSLLCICKPLACHGDVIKSAVEWLDRWDRSKGDAPAG
jgi:hypothetical protein